MLNLNYRALLRHSLAALATLALCSGALAEEPAKPTPAATPKSSPEQAKRAPRPGDVQKVFILKNAPASSVARILSAFPATVSESTSLSAVAVSAAPPVMAVIEETIRRIDTPPAAEKSADITVYIIEALTTRQADAKVPAFLDPIVDQLKNTFRYADYRLADTLAARAIVDGRTWLRADAVSEQLPSVTYALRTLPVLVSSTSGRAIRMGGMDFTFNYSVNYSGGSRSGISRITADVYIPEGQYVVVGKSGTGQPGNAIILVLSAKIID
jgi:hypothetical protein